MHYTLRGIVNFNLPWLKSLLRNLQSYSYLCQRTYCFFLRNVRTCHTVLLLFKVRLNFKVIAVSSNGLPQTPKAVSLGNIRDIYRTMALFPRQFLLPNLNLTYYKLN